MPGPVILKLRLLGYLAPPKAVIAREEVALGKID
jgi:hypothetical protein